MAEILILKSIDGRVLTNKLVDSWFDANEIFVIKKNFSIDRQSVEVTFIDEERADMMLDMLNTCYSDYVSISRPQTLISSLDNSFEEEREPSPVHLSSALSTSSRVSCFSQRLVQLERNNNNNNTMKFGIGRGRGTETSLSQLERPSITERNDDNKDSIRSSNTASPAPSINNSTISSIFGRGRGAVFK